MRLPLLLVVTIFILFASYVGLRFFSHWMEQRQIVSIPNDRSSHSHPTPQGGGLVIVLAILGAWFCYLAITNPSLPDFPILAYLLGGALVALVSWRDDLEPLPNWLRLVVHSGAALIVLTFISYWQTLDLPLVGSIALGWLGIPLTFLWIVGLTNAYNFMDGIDGLAGGQAVIAGLGWAILAWQSNQAHILSLSLFLVAASLGFLTYNWPPARIFMGDVGSAFLGYTFATIPLLASPPNSKILVAALLFVWPFIFDTGFTLLRRLYHGENIFKPHRSHLYQRLTIVGYSHRFVTFLYLVAALFNALLGYWWAVSNNEIGPIILLLLTIESSLLWYFVIHQEKEHLSTVSTV